MVGKELMVLVSCMYTHANSIHTHTQELDTPDASRIREIEDILDCKYMCGMYTTAAFEYHATYVSHSG